MKIEIATLLIVAGVGGAAAAEEFPDVVEAPAARPAVQSAADDGAFLPLTLSPRVGAAQALASGSGGYDTAARSPLAESAAEVHIWGPIDLRGAVSYAQDSRRLRPSVGARVQVLRQAAHGVDGSVAVFYKTEGFTETEGEIETTLAFGRRFGGTAIYANLVYGQDPEGNERDGEVRAAILRHQGRLAVGFDGRTRRALGPQRGRGASEAAFDAALGPIGLLVIGPIALYAEAGPTALELATRPMAWGASALAGLGTAF